ncbi:MAG TPA: hypothetical protein VJR02_00215 [Pyrinomonadaceae bacterium]|nr:hypothetical protein [Pyrinomonadaceae bacterium]
MATILAGVAPDHIHSCFSTFQSSIRMAVLAGGLEPATFGFVKVAFYPV